MSFEIGLKALSRLKACPTVGRPSGCAPVSTGAALDLEKLI
jgi:hypothetical protein